MFKLLFHLLWIVTAVLAFRVCPETLLLTDLSQRDANAVQERLEKGLGLKVTTHLISATKKPRFLDVYSQPLYCNVILGLKESAPTPGVLSSIYALATEHPDVESDIAWQRAQMGDFGVNVAIFLTPSHQQTLEAFAQRFGIVIGNEEKTNTPQLPDVNLSAITKEPLNSGSTVPLFLEKGNRDGARFPIFKLGNRDEDGHAGIALQSGETNTRVMFLGSIEPILKRDKMMLDLIEWVTQHKNAYRLSMLKPEYAGPDDGHDRSQWVLMADHVDVYARIERLDCGVAGTPTPCVWTDKDVAQSLEQFNGLPQVEESMIEVQSRATLEPTEHVVILPRERDAPEQVVQANFVAHMQVRDRAYVARYTVDYNRRGVSHIWGQVPLTVRYRMMNEYPRKMGTHLPFYVIGGAVIAVFLYLPVLVTHTMSRDLKTTTSKQE